MSAAHQPVSIEKPDIATAPPPKRAPEPPRSKKWLILAGVIAVVVLAAALWKTTSQPEPAKQPAVAATVKTAAVTTGNLERTVRIGGQTAAVQFANVTAPIMRGREASSEMILLFVSPGGSWVKKGQLVARIDGQSMQDHIDDLQDTIEAARSDIRKREAEQAIDWGNLQQRLTAQKIEWDKARLEYNGSETRTDIERQLLKLTLDEQEARYKQLQADQAQKKASYAADLKILNLTLKRHVSHQERHKRDLENFSIHAAMDGLVVMQQIFRGGEFGQVQQGDRLNPGQPFMKIVNTKSMQVEGSVNQAESSEFRVGQPARVKLDAFPGLEFNAKIHSIGALASSPGRMSGNYIRVVPIKLAIEGNDPRLIPDLSASADVIFESAANQTIVPLSALHNQDGKTVAQVKTGDTFTTREVTTGLRNGTQAVVMAGLNPGEIVRIN